MELFVNERTSPVDQLVEKKQIFEKNIYELRKKNGIEKMIKTTVASTMMEQKY